MRPEYLKMQAFGPYTSLTECDFTKFYTSRLFLIAGPTGSGKTSILDAMSFALYGHATGELRGFRDMRNTSCPPTLDTFVEFVFELGSKKYKFSRSLHYRKKRSGGLAEQLTAECHVFENSRWNLICSGWEMVRRKAAEILGFTHSQFSQVIVLPQGEFRRLLLASSKEKSEILQVLFATSFWKRIGEYFILRQKTVREQLELTYSEYNTLLSSTGCSSAEELTDKIQSLKTETDDTAKAIKSISQKTEKLQQEYNEALALSQQFERLKSYRQQFNNLLSKWEEIEKIKQEYNTGQKTLKFIPYYNQYKSCLEDFESKQKAFEDLKALLSETKAELERIEAKAQNIDQLKAAERQLRDSLAEISALLPDAQRLNDVENSVKSLSQNESELNRILSLIQSKSESLKNQYQETSKALKDCYEEYIQPLPELQEQYARLEQEIKNLDTLNETAEKLKKALTQLEELKSKQQLAEDNLELKKANLEALQNEMKRNSAYMLAIDLAEGSPCPVCGSVHHPRPALNPGEFDPEKLKAAEEEYNKAAEELNVFNLRIAEQNAIYDNIKSEHEKYKQLCANIDDPVSVRETFIQLQQKIELCKQEREKYDSINSKLSELKSKIDQLDSQYKSHESSLNELKAELAAALSTKAELIKRLGSFGAPAELKQKHDALLRQADNINAEYTSLELQREKIRLNYHKAEEAQRAAEKALEESKVRYIKSQKELENQASALGIGNYANIDLSISESHLEQLKQTFETYDTEHSNLKHQIKTIQSELEGKTQPDCQAIAENLAEHQTRQNQLLEQHGKQKSEFDHLTATKQKLDTIAEKTAQLEDTYSKVARVCDFVSGKNHLKTPLHNFVIGLMLDEVVFAASRYLLNLSRGRYQLIRVDEPDGGNALRGLDIEVIDAHIGGRRKVCTLSGGELFLASLSLAFGLAEVVQRYSGGVKLDSIFIDEGFGTLDPQTLEVAINALSEIQKGGRLVGIISHVSELRARIPSRIEVIKEQEGSRLKIVTID